MAQPAAKPGAKGDLKIGVLFSKEGAWGSYGAKSFRAIDAAIADANEAGGVNGYKLV
ncbi:MAG: ABC transporter substrate-binding protein [Chloroflexi bacterium]|nr:ABC transporter substrate-binding protein [Chloroflexota bacterium]